MASSCRDWWCGGSGAHRGGEAVHERREDGRHDYPSGAVAADGTVWAAWQSYTPGIDRGVRAKSYDKSPPS